MTTNTKTHLLHNARRVQILRAYAARQKDALRGLHFIETYTRPEFYLAKAAERLIYLNYNRVACEAIGHGRFASDRSIMAEVLRNKSIARGMRPLNSPIVFDLAGRSVEFTHVGGVA